jgi:hypothetical protein
MGYSQVTWKCFNKYLRESGLLNAEQLPLFRVVDDAEGYYGKEMLELGCQTFRGNIRKKINSGLYNHNCKDYFQSIGIKCLSIDIKGCRGSMVVDLSKPMHTYFYNRFDIITNSGTTEHVSELAGQYSVFENIHKCSNVNGVMMHFVPVYGVERKPHGFFNYDDSFFEILAKLNNYEIVSIEKYDRKNGDLYWGVCLKKIRDREFTTDKEQFYKGIKGV